MAPASPNWSIECDYLKSCNCDFGCSCNFSGFPNFGRCEALVGIRGGNYGQTPLDGLDFIYAASWPKAIHQGNGTMRLYIDQRASAEPAGRNWGDRLRPCWRERSIQDVCRHLHLSA
jgi:hypothetical protein